MDNQKILCNNCGNNGHLFYNCRKPITSFGILCYRINLQNENFINDEHLYDLKLESESIKQA
jgi:hypothetical protein